VDNSSINAIKTNLNLTNLINVGASFYYWHFLKKKILWKSAIYYSIKLPFDAEVAEKVLNGIK
jgi:hypothetical protein